MQFCFMLFTQEESISVKMLVITYNNITRFKFANKIRICSVFYHCYSITNNTHFITVLISPNLG